MVRSSRGRGDQSGEEDDQYNNISNRNNVEEVEEEEGEEEEEYCAPKSSWKNRFFSSSNGLLLCGRTGTNRLPTAGHSQGLFFIHPDNWWYLIWKQFILVWAVYSSFFTPLEFGFFRGLPENLFLLDIAGQFAFLIDIIVHFFVAYRDSHSHRMIYNRNLISIRYLKSRFLVDFLGCLPWDAIYKICGRKEVVRYLLWIRLSRALRVTEFFEKLEKDIRINYLFTRIVKLFVVELYCTHTAACIFYHLATTLPESKEGYTWIGSLKMGEYSYSHFREIDMWTRYVTSLYFAIITMATLGYGDIHAVNTREMIFIMIYVSFDMILGAYLLGNMAALIVKGSRTERFRDKMTDVIKYMNRKKLGRQISNEIKGHLRLQYEIDCTEPAVLQDIPVSFRAKISQKIYEPYLREVLLFKGCSLGFIKQIATRAHEEFFLPGEVIIEQGHVADQLYIVCHGKLEELGRSEGDETEESRRRLQTYSSLGEISVLCNIPVPYTVLVCEFSRLLRLDKQSLVDILEIYFSDGRIIVNNILEGKELSLRNKILESDITLHIGKHESELAMRLNCAAYYGDLFRLKHLVEAGADTDKTDYDGRSPLHLAASKGYEDITQFLIQNGASINVKDNYGNTPLFEAIKNGHDHVVAMLVKAGGSLNIDNAGSCLCTAVARGDLDFLRRLLANGINPNSKNFDLRTPLHLAASEGLYSMAYILIEAGASAFSKDRWGNTPLDEARVGGNRNLIKLLEDANCAQLSEFSNCSKQAQDKTRRRKCTVFPSNPWDQKERRRRGIVLWVPERIEDLIKAAQEELAVTGHDCCIISEDGGKIVDVGFICDDQKLFLVSESTSI